MEKTVQHMHEIIDALYQLTDVGGPIIESIALGGLRAAEETLRTAVKTLHNYGRSTGEDTGFVNDLVTAESLQELAAVASEFDKTGNPILMKQASVIDELLLTIAVQKGAVQAIRQAHEQEIERIKSQLYSEAAEKNTERDPYADAKKFHAEQNNKEEAAKAIQNVKHYRPLEAPLSTRVCPDHAGSQIHRVGNNMWQCCLDKKIYDFNSGFTLMNGNTVAGGNTANQTQMLDDHPNESTSFDTRESRLNS